MDNDKDLYVKMCDNWELQQRTLGDDMKDRVTEANWIWTGRCPGCKQTTQPVIQIRFYLQRIVSGQVEMVNQNDMRKTFQIM